MTGDPPLAGAGGPRIVVMGVSAAGKSSVASGLAARLGTRWVDADDLHPAANIEKMAEGIPLEDEDRWPWLDDVAARIEAESRAGGIVVACSALRRVYRDRMRARAAGLVFVHLVGSRELLARRAVLREGHFMPASLLETQLNTLEPLDSDEAGFALDVSGTVQEIVDEAVERYAQHAS